MSEVIYHIDEEGRQVIAERDGEAVGVMPWTLDGKKVIIGVAGRPVVVAAHERRKGIGSGLATTGRERFPREDGWEMVTTTAISPLLRKHLYAKGKADRRNNWFDYVGPEDTTPIPTPTVTQVLNLAQQDLDRLLGK